jgi:hypothetical protein
MIDQEANQSEAIPIMFDQKVSAVYAGHGQSYLRVDA